MRTGTRAFTPFVVLILAALTACNSEPPKTPSLPKTPAKVQRVAAPIPKPPPAPPQPIAPPVIAKPVAAAPTVAEKSEDGSKRKPIELGRSSIAQAEEPEVRTPDFHGWDPLGADCAWFRELKRDVSADPVDPHSEAMLRRLVKGNGHIDAQWSGSWTPAKWDWHTIPFQVVSGDTAPLSVPGKWSYLPPTNGPYMLPGEPIVHEGCKHTKYACEKWKGGDHHLFVYVRDEETGGFKELWEYYQPWVKRDEAGKITKLHGASWRRFDLRNGETPPPNTPSTDAAGLPFLPLVVRYDEVARGSINHALRFCVNNTDISPTFKWPARTAAGAWNREAGMPYGTRLRLKESWWKENADDVLGVGTQARIIGEAMRRHGLILADGSGGTSVQLCGVADKRWEKKLHERLNAIPVSALEVVATPPTLKIEGPQTLKVGEKGSWKMTLLPEEAPIGVGSNINIYDAKGKLLKYRFAVIDTDHRTVTAEHRFDQPGTYTIKPYREWNTGFGPYRIKVENDPK